MPGVKRSTSFALPHLFIIAALLDKHSEVSSGGEVARFREAKWFAHGCSLEVEESVKDSIKGIWHDQAKSDFCRENITSPAS